MYLLTFVLSSTRAHLSLFKSVCSKTVLFTTMLTFLFQPIEEANRRHGRFGTASRSPIRTDFFNVYSSHSSKRDPNSFQVCNTKESSDGSLAVLQTPNRSHAAYKQWDEGQDQRVPFNMAGTCSTTGKENRKFHVPREGPSSSKFVLQKERLSGTENKRSTSQILALFSSSTNTPPEYTGIHQGANSGMMNDTQLMCNLNETANKVASRVDAAKVTCQTTNVSEIINAFQPSILYNDSLEQVLETSDDLGDSLNLSPDSFAACSIENVGCNFIGEDAMCEDATQESAFTRSPDNIQRHSKAWSQNDSESVSPLIRLLTSVEQADTQGCIDVKEVGGQPSKNMVIENRLLDHCSFESPDSVIMGSPSSRLDPPPSPSVYSRRQPSYGVPTSEVDEASSSEFQVQASCLSERNMSSSKPDIISTLITLNEDVSASYENTLHSQPKLDRFNISPKGISSHPGSLFPYSKLQSPDQNNHLRNSSDSSLFRKGFTSFEQADSSLEHQAIDDGEGNFQHYELSPEFYPPESEKTSEWRVAPIVSTEVIPIDSRTVSIIACLWLTLHIAKSSLLVINIGHTTYAGDKKIKYLKLRKKIHGFS